MRGRIIYKFFTKGDKMTEEQKSKCHAIIHSHAVAAAAGNAIPVPGLGVAVDIATMTTMAMALSAVFASSEIKENVAKTMAIAAVKQTLLKQPIKTMVKEASKVIPGLGQVVSAAMAISFLEAAGWILANELDAKYSSKLLK